MFDSVTIIDIFTVLTAVLALVVSCWSVYISKRNLVATAITANRIEWIKTVREIIFKFLIEYQKNNKDKSQLICIYEELMLYFNPVNMTYTELVAALKDCLSEEYSIEKSCAVIERAQALLSSSFVRMKREAGISKRAEDNMARHVFDEFPVEERMQWRVNWSKNKNQ